MLLCAQQARLSRERGYNVTITELASELGVGESKLERMKILGEMAFDKLEICNMRLVLRYCSRYANVPNLDYEQLVTAAATGLHKAIRRFDVSKGYRFSTYAVHNIRGATRIYVSDQTRFVGVSRRLQEILQAIIQAQDELTAMNGVSPSDREVGDRIGIPEFRVTEALADYDKAIRKVNPERAVKSPEASTQSSFSMDKYQAAHQPVLASTVFDTLQDGQIRHVLNECSLLLSEREDFVFRRRLHLDNVEDENRISLSAIGEELNLSAERIRLLELSAYKKIRFGPLQGLLNAALGDRIDVNATNAEWKSQMIEALSASGGHKSSRTWQD